MKKLCISAFTIACLLATACVTATTPAAWQPSGWGGGAYYWAAAFHPARNGLIYMGADEGGVYRTEDHGRHWRMINNGLANYGVYSLAVDRKSPETVYAATTGGLCKSTDSGDHWQLLPKTGRNDLRITGERGLSVRSIAVDPTNSNIVYAGSPKGTIYKSADGGQTWKPVYELMPPAMTGQAPPPTVLRAQFGGVNAGFFGGFCAQLALPSGVMAEDLHGFGFSFKGNGAVPKTASVILWTTDGAKYDSKKTIPALFEKTDWQEVALTADDFTLDPSLVRKQPEKAKAWPKQPDWQKVNKVDFQCANMDNGHPSVGLFGAFYFVKKGSPRRVVVKDFAVDKSCGIYGNARVGDPHPPKAGTIFNVTVAEKNPAMVLAATQTSGIVLSEDGGLTWQALPTPKYATSVALAATDPNILLGAFGAEGIWKSTDKGKSWVKSSEGIKSPVLDVAVSPANAQDVYAIGSTIDWHGHFYASHDGGKTWKESSRMANDHNANPSMSTGLSKTTNLSINPSNPQELFISANWSPCISSDGGRTWSESCRGADNTCFTDIRFQGTRVYGSAMDEGEFVSDDNGQHWRRLWPAKFDPEVSGHIWQQAIVDNNGKDRIITTCSPWNGSLPNRVIISEDGGATFKITKTGLPDYRPTANTMWGMSYPRGLVVDPSNPKVVYLGMDGDATDGKCGGGIFKSVDGGYTWKQLAHQPGSRRCYFGLSIDPTDSKRLYWGACGSGGGVWRSEDGGDSWQHVFKNGSWVFNVMVTPNGDVYCAETNVWRSTDHGKTWKKLTHFTGPAMTVGLATDPRDSKTLWVSRLVWSTDAGGGVYKTTDGGSTWTDITGNLPCLRPSHLRFNPASNELWAAGVGAYRIKQ
jgi:photosystem II stability/assembly factor-like uncharacterized protein